MTDTLTDNTVWIYSRDDSKYVLEKVHEPSRLFIFLRISDKLKIDLTPEQFQQDMQPIKP